MSVQTFNQGRLENLRDSALWGFRLLGLEYEILNHGLEFLRFIAPGIKTSSQDRKRPVAWINGEGRDNAPACVILDINVRRVVIELGLLKRGQSIDVRRPGSHN